MHVVKKRKGIFSRVREAFEGDKPVEYQPTSALERFAEQGIRPLIMTEQLENRLALMVQGVRNLVSAMFNPSIKLEDKMKALDKGLEMCIVIAMAWGRGLQVWHVFSAQFRELRTMPAFWDSLVEEFIDMINKGWLPEDVLTPRPVVMITPVVKGGGLDLGEFEESTRPQVSE